MRQQWDFIYCSFCYIQLCLAVGTLTSPIEKDDCKDPLDVDAKECCSAGKNGTRTMNEPLIPEKCSSILIDLDALSQEESEKAFECFFECLFTTADMLNKGNKIDADNILMNLTYNLLPTSRALSINSIKKCVEKDYEVKETAECKSGSLQFFLCVQRQNILYCPTEDWNNSDECNRYKSLLEKCPKRTPIFGLFESQVENVKKKLKYK